MEDYSEYRCDFLSMTEIRECAELFRNEYWPEASLPVNMETIIEERLDMDIIPASNIQTDAWLQFDMTAIVIDQNQYMDERDRYSNRFRFSIAHEIGHMVLHQYIRDRFDLTDEEAYVRFVQNIPEPEYRRYEFQANEFAGRLLVPRQVLLNEIGKVIEVLERENQLALLESRADDIMARASSRIGTLFGVSPEVIVIRVEREKIWPPKDIG